MNFVFNFAANSSFTRIPINVLFVTFFFFFFFWKCAFSESPLKVPHKLCQISFNSCVFFFFFFLLLKFVSLIYFQLTASQSVIEIILFTYLLFVLQQVQHPENIVKKTSQHFLLQQLILMFPWSIQHMFSAQRGHIRIAGLSFIPYNVLPTTNIVKHWYAFTTSIHK